MVPITVVTVLSPTENSRSGECRSETVREGPVFKVASEKSIFENY